MSIYVSDNLKSEYSNYPQSDLNFDKLSQQMMQKFIDQFSLKQYILDTGLWFIAALVIALTVIHLLYYKFKNVYRKLF